MCQSVILEELCLKMRIRFQAHRHISQIYSASYFNFGQKLIVAPPLFQCKFPGLALLFDSCNLTVLARLIKMDALFCLSFIHNQHSDCMKKGQDIFLRLFHIRLRKVMYLEWRPFDFSKLFDFDFLFSMISFWKITDLTGRHSFAGSNSWEHLS